jgi:uncharacterized protein
MAITRQQIESIVAQLVAEFRPERVILFGSQARQDGGPDSDIDLLVVQRFDGSRFAAAARMRARLDSAVSIDLVLRRPEELLSGLPGDFLAALALREGVTLFERAA